MPVVIFPSNIRDPLTINVLEMTIRESNSSESESALFHAENRQKAPQFFFQKAPQFWSKPPHFETFLFGMKLKMTHPTFFNAFLCDNFSRATQSCKIILNSNFFPRIFLKIVFFLPAPKYFWRHKEFPNRHSGYL